MGVSVGIAGLETRAGAAIAAALAAGGDEPGPPAAGRQVLIDAASAPSGPDDPLREDVLPELLARAEDSGARIVLLSSALVYAGAGEEWIEASEPDIAPAPAHAALPALELSVFASGARFLILRMGVLAEQAAAPGGAWIPVLAPEDLGVWVARAIALDLNGVYDAVSRCVRGAADASRRVSGAALARDTAHPPYEASAS